ncbi:hypothetical protein Ancab_026870 [Ancistrocladus abbreviatus]
MASLTKESVVQQQQPSPHTSSFSAVPPQAEDESRKKNTDCVYFLASPLTCKKGSECEYRHSEAARLNPRDCWYWMNTLCLNPKCSFRHPPLDGLLGVPAAASGGSSFTPTPAVSASPYNAAKQGVACIFYQKGYCLKGDRCPFLHGSNPASYKVPQVPAAGTTEPPAPAKGFSGLEKCTQTKITQQANNSKLVESFPEAKATPKAPTALPRDGSTPTVKSGPHLTGLIKELPNNKDVATVPINNGNSRSKSSHFHLTSSLDDPDFQNDKDADEFLRESSPGFDVLVDDDLRDTHYYHNEDHFVRIGGHDGRNLNELEIGHCDDYTSVADSDSNVYRDPCDYDTYGCVEERYAQEQHRGSSDRSAREAVHFDRAGSVEDSDLRHLLSKQRRVGGLRSVVSPDYCPKRHPDERSSQNAQRESYHSPPHEGSLSSRLQGRIKLPTRSVNDGNMNAEWENGRGRNWGRLSPSKPQLPSRQGKLRDRPRGRVQNDSIEGKNFGARRMRRDMLDDSDTNFAGPKSLAELKVAKGQQMKHDESASLGKRRYSMLEGSQPAEGDLTFEGPKPLSEILKRKREAGGAASMGALVVGNKVEDKQTGNKKLQDNSNSGSAIQEKQMESCITLSLMQEPEVKLPDLANTEESKSVTADGDAAKDPVPNKEKKLTEPELSKASDINVSENDEALIAGGVDDNEHEVEEYGQGEGEYEFEQEDGEGYNLEEGGNAYPEEDYMDEDDGDDFAKKIGVMFS